MKTNKRTVPSYRDGVFHVFKVMETDDLIPKKTLQALNIRLCYEELGIYDKTRFELSQLDRELTAKLRISQCKDITVRHIIQINDIFHEVYNITHFTNKDGHKQSDITLVEWSGSL